ncbi:MAG TPA: lactate racemase domain-containing protein [Sedimentisphaerales bacterium]|nr:lactate racemase domain-containing protein [Sedimentisphaerales bacterium]
MKIDLHYGKGIVSLQVARQNIEEIIRPWQDKAAADNLALIEQALSSPEAKDFRTAITGKRLCVLTEDGTREPVLDETLLAPVFNLMSGSSHVQFLISTGTHDPDTPQNAQIIGKIRRAARKARLPDFEIHTHDCQHEKFINAGQTSRGTNVLFNAAIDDADVFLVLSDMKTHYFAGYSNPIKNFVPGVCAFETTEHNHSLALDSNSTFGLHPWHNDPNRRNNPLAQDQLEAMQMIVNDRPVYVLGTISTSGKIQWARFAAAQSVTAEAFDKIDERNTHTVTPVGRLIVSPGGLPNDVTLYIAQRALELTKNAVTDNGEVLFLAACPDGIGEERTMEHFYNLLTLPTERILQSIEAEYKLYSHKPYKFAQMIRRLRKIWMHTEIPDNLIEAAHIHPTHEPQNVIDNWLGEDPDTRITIVDGANKIALYARP